MHKLFVDLDGVLADFEEGVQRVTGRHPDEMHPHTMWKQLAAEPGFYEHLEWMPDGRLLWEKVRGLEPTILTGLPLGKWARAQKLAWCARELGPDVPVITCWSRQKASVAERVTPPSATPVLIDDRDWLRGRWESIDGIFIHHTDAETTIRTLEELLDEAE
jgi:hypothetical protein